MAISDEQIGKNVRRIRGDLSQKDLAASMSAHGWKWSQSTVWSIEKGERPLRVAEAEDLAAILETISSQFAVPDGASQIYEHMRRMQRTSQALESAIRDLYEAQLQLAFVADENANSLNDTTQTGVERWLRTTPTELAKDVRRRASLDGEMENRLDWGDDEDSAARFKAMMEETSKLNGPMVRIHQEVWSADGQHSEEA